MTNKYLDEIYKKKYSGINIHTDWQNYMLSLGVRRNKDATKVLIFPGAIDCCAYYRTFVPYMEIAKDPRVDIRISTVLSQRSDIDWADHIVFQRKVSQEAVLIAKQAKQCGKATYFDIDDYLHGLPDYHPYKGFYENGNYLQEMDELCNVVDRITVSTPYLKILYKERYPSALISVVKNTTQIRPVAKRRLSKRTYIGWAGGLSHKADLAILVNPIRAILKEHPEVDFMTINYPGYKENDQAADVFAEIPANRRIHLYGTEPHLVSNLISLLDIGLAPLIDNDFNWAKSNVKFMEYAMCGVPMIATKIGPYIDDAEACALVNNGTSEWYREMDWLVQNKKCRIEIANEARKRLTEVYDSSKISLDAINPKR